MGQAGGHPTGGVPKVPQLGWYKRRLPWVGPVPMPANAGLILPVPPGTQLPIAFNPVAGRSRRALVFLGRLALPRPIGVRPKPPLVVRSDYRRAGVVYKIPLLKPPQGGLVPPHWVVRRDYERKGLVYRLAPPLQAPPANVAGGVPPPWVVRRDYRHGGQVQWMRPPLKPPPPPGVLTHIIHRWDFERAALVYRTHRIWKLLPPLAPLPPLDDSRSWFACGRDNEWDSCNRTLTWSADVTSYLTKRSGETRQYTMDFSALPELQNANLSGVTSVTATALSVGAANVTLTNPALGADGKSATVWIANGVSGARYKITFTVTLAGGTVLEDFGYLLVEDE